MSLPIFVQITEKEIDHVYYTLKKSLSVNSMSKYQNRTSDIRDYVLELQLQ